jgi:hypothetical protein
MTTLRVSDQVNASTRAAFRRLTIGDRHVLDDPSRVALPPELATLVRITALIALDGPSVAYRKEFERSERGSVDLDELLAVLVAVAEQVGWPRIVAAAPRIAMAAGYDVEEELDRPGLPGNSQVG